MGEHVCTPEQHVADLQQIVSLVWPIARREGYLAGHEAGQLEGHLNGFAEGVRAPENVVYQIAAGDQYRTGYVDGLADRRARQGVSV